MTWNLNPRYRQVAEYAKQNGAYLLVAENGYVQKHRDLEPFYALARDGHNGSGMWFVGSGDRWGKLNQPLHPWRRNEGYVLIAGQRGIGSEIMKCPRNFVDSTQIKLRRILDKGGQKKVKIAVRLHPGRHAPLRSLRDDLAGARCVVTWASNVANTALIYGIPAFRMAPYHVNDAVIGDVAKIVDPPLADREEGFKKLAWAQWSLSEIDSGAAFTHLLQDVT